MATAAKIFGIMAILVGVLGTSSASAGACSSYDRQVYDIAQAVAKFRQTKQFTKTHGWSAAGPYHQWLKQIQALNEDKENARRLFATHGFVPMEIYSVADEVRTAGKLDSFYQDIDKNIKSLKCNPA